MNPNKMSVREFVRKLDGRGFKASPNRNVIVVRNDAERGHRREQ